MSKLAVENHCWHCDKDFKLLMIGGMTICSKCEAEGHIDAIGCPECERKDTLLNTEEKKSAIFC